MASETVKQILECAESQARAGGYNAFSFREIAKEIGIKSASIHYHFPTKADLASALAKRYTENFAVHLQEIETKYDTLHDKVKHFADLFRHALIVDQKMCLCGIFAAEIEVLPDAVKTETKEFFETNLAWLKKVLAQHEAADSEKTAKRLLASAEGAMMLAKVFNSPEYFDDAFMDISGL